MKEHEPVGLREPRHNTGEILARVRRGETVDVTEYGGQSLVSSGPGREPAPVLDRLAASGRLRPAVRPGYRPRMHPPMGSDTLGDALAALRDEERS